MAGFPYDDPENERDGEAWAEEDAREELRERELAEQDRLADKAPARRRAVSRVIPPGEGSPQVEFYRRVTGAPEVREIVIEEE